MIENETTYDNKPATQGVTFTAEQQTKLDEIIRDSMRRTAREVRQQLEAEKQRATQLETDLQVARDALANASNSEERDRLADEVQTLTSDLATEKAARLTAEQIATAKRRESFISKKCLDYNFVDADIVASLTESDIEWSEQKQGFVIVDSEMSPEEYFADFATKKPYLVKSDIRTGSGSSDSSRSGLNSGQQRYKVTDVFGRGSNSQLANKIALESPAEYRRLKSEAKNKRLI
jgi:exonuclease VII large subunit